MIINTFSQLPEFICVLLVPPFHTLSRAPVSGGPTRAISGGRLSVSLGRQLIGNARHRTFATRPTRWCRSNGPNGQRSAAKRRFDSHLSAVSLPRPWGGQALASGGGHAFAGEKLFSFKENVWPVCWPARQRSSRRIWSHYCLSQSSALTNTRRERRALTLHSAAHLPHWLR